MSFGRALVLTALSLAVTAAGCHRQAPERSTSDATRQRARRHVVVMVPGYASGKLIMTGAGEHLQESLGAEAHGISFSDLGIMKPIPEYAGELRDFVKSLKLKEGDRLDFVAFSMGGLVCRWYIEEMNGRADNLVTVCTPHHGTTKGAFSAGTSSSVRDMQPGSAFLKKLNDGKLPDGTKYHSIRIAGDRTVRPRYSAILPGAENFLFPGRLHSMTIFRKEVRDLIAAALAGKAKPVGPQAHSEDERRALAGD